MPTVCRGVCRKPAAYTTLPFAEREFGRAAARRMLAEDDTALASLLTYARRGLREPGEAQIRVTVSQGPFRSERVANFTAADGTAFSLIVDAGDVDGDLLRVAVLGERDGLTVVRLPRDATAGHTATMRTADVLKGEE